MQRRHTLRTLAWITLFVLIIVPNLAVQLAAAQQPVTRSQDIQLTVNDSLIISSNRTSIQRVVIQGNLSLASIKKPAQYPADNFAISAHSPASYAVQLLFNYSSDYQINLFAKAQYGSMAGNNSTYYVSSGPLELNIKVTFNLGANETAPVVLSLSPWQGFVKWLGKFGEAFPIWVKLVYLTFGVQFLLVGGLWIRRESEKKETGAQHLDTGDKAFLWVDIAYKFLLVSFVTIVAVMGGEVLVLFILRFMFLVSLDLLSLWDLFVVGFAAGAVFIAYLIRFTLEKAFDLKPVQDE